MSIGPDWHQHYFPRPHDHLDVLHAALSSFPRGKGENILYSKDDHLQRRHLTIVVTGIDEGGRKVSSISSQEEGRELRAEGASGITYSLQFVVL